MQHITHTFCLQNDTIAEQCGYIRKELSMLRTDRSDLVFIDLALEELLLALQSRYGAQKEATLVLTRHFSRCVIRVDWPGDPCNILKNALKGLGYDEFILPVLDRQVVYSYGEGCNHYDLQIAVHPKISFGMSMLIAMAAAAVCGLIARLFLPENITGAVNALMDAISTSIMNIMRLLAAPLVFCGMINGITGCGNLRRLRKIGSGLLRRILLSMAFVLLLTMTLAMIIFPLSFSPVAGGVSVFQSILDTVVDAVPSSIVSPFLTGDGIQIVILSVCTGIILLMIGNQSARITVTFHRTYDALMIALDLVNHIIPLLIFALVLNLFCEFSPTDGFLLLQAMMLELVIVAILITAEVLLTAAKTGRRVKSVLRSAWPIIAKGFFTASAVSAYSETEHALQSDFGLDRESSAFGLSFATGIFGVANTVSLPLVVIFSAHIAGIGISAGWVFSLAIQCFVFSLAIPSSTGGMLFVLSALFTSFGIPMEYLAIGTPLLMLVDYPSTSLRASATFLEIAREYGKKAEE